MSGGRALVLAAAALLAPFAGAGAQEDGATHLVVITGLGGDRAHSTAFHELALGMLDAARDRFGLPDERLTYLGENPELAPGRTAGRSTRDNIERVMGELAGRVAPADQVLVVLIAHGSARGGESAVNLPGPDMTGSDFARLLAAFPTQTVAVVNTASASGGFVPALAGTRRVVITATRSPRERNETRFGRYWVEAFSEDVADVDKDGRVSLLEAFEYARREVSRSYEADNLLLTEHALLEDDGDGEGALAVEAGAGDGSLARRFFLGAGPVAASATAAAATDDPELTALYARRLELEQEVAALRARKAELEPARYESELEALLLELARTNRAIREREGGAR